MKTPKFKKQSPIAFIIWGILIYTLAYNVIYPLNKYMGHIGGLFGILVTFYSLFQIKHKFHLQMKGFDRFLMFFFFSYILVVIFRGLSEPITQDTFINLVTNKRGIIGYLTPFILFLGIRKIDIHIIFKFCYISAIIGVIFVLINFHEIFFTSHLWIAEGSWEKIKYAINIGQIPGYFILPSSFMLMNYNIVPSKYVKVGWIAFILSLATAIAYGRRSYIVFHIILLLSIGYIFIASRKTSHLKKISIFVIVIISITVIISSYANSNFFEVLLNRFDANTRGGVELFFYSDFYGRTIDLIFGRGIFGTYYCPVNFGTYYTNNYRTIIETGYLQFILNGGIIILFLYVFILLKGAFIGFFKSSNTISKTMAIFLFANVLFLFSGNTLEFTFKGILIWICVFFLYSKEFRMIKINY